MTIGDSGSARIEGHIRLRDTRPFRTEYRFVYVDQEGFKHHPPKDFAGLVAAFRDRQTG